LIFYDSDGRPQRLVGVNIDITERKRAEETQRLKVWRFLRADLSCVSPMAVVR
jgi:hypothetical protein